MEGDLKRKLLGRMFSSVEYMEKMSNCHESAVKSLEDALSEFYIHSAQRHDWHVMPKSDWPEAWESRVLSNLKESQKALRKVLRTISLETFQRLEVRRAVFITFL